MAFKTIQDLETDNTVALGGYNKKLKKENPTQPEGYFLGTKKTKNTKNDGVSSLHILQTPKGNVGVWGKTDLDRKMLNVVAGTMVRITHTGMQQTKNGEMYKYRVEIDNENSIPIELTPAKEYGSTASFTDEEPTDEDEGEGVEDSTPDPTPTRVNAAKSKAKLERLLGRNSRAG